MFPCDCAVLLLYSKCPPYSGADIELPVDMAYNDGYLHMDHTHIHTQRDGGAMLRGSGIVPDRVVLTLGRGQ